MLFGKKETQELTVKGGETSPALSGMERGIMPPINTEDEDKVPRFYQGDLAAEPETVASISRNSMFRGDIQTSDPLKIFGAIEGNLSGNSVIRLEGAVKGEIHCASLLISGGRVEGNIVVTSSLTIEKGGQVLGNIQCERALISGVVKGNIDTTENLVLSEQACVTGDLSAAELEIQKGASFNGAIKMKQPDKKKAKPPVAALDETKPAEEKEPQMNV